VPKPKTKKMEVIASPDNDRRQRRKFTAAQKARFLEEADACERGQLGALLRREGIYSSQLATWRAQREQLGLEGLAGSKPGPKSTKDARDRTIESQEKRIAALEKELRISRALIDLQKKAHEILGIALPTSEDHEENTSSNLSKNERKRSQ
jgi:transposase-like protein